MRRIIFFMIILAIFSISCGENQPIEKETTTRNSVNQVKTEPPKSDNLNSDMKWVERVVSMEGERTISFSIPDIWEVREKNSPICDATGYLFISDDYLSNEMSWKSADKINLNSVAIFMDCPRGAPKFDEKNIEKFGRNSFFQKNRNVTLADGKTKLQYLELYWYIERDEAIDIELYSMPGKIMNDNIRKFLESLKVVK